MQQHLVFIFSWLTIFLWSIVVFYLILSSDGFDQLIHKVDGFHNFPEKQSNRNNERRFQIHRQSPTPSPINPTSFANTVTNAPSNSIDQVKSVLVVLGNEPLGRRNSV